MKRTFIRLAAAAAVSLSLAACATTGQYFDDSWVTSKVKTSLVSAGLGEITVETQNGVVQLAGFTNSQADIDKAVAEVRKIEGVKSVSNRVQLKSSTK